MFLPGVDPPSLVAMASGAFKILFGNDDFVLPFPPVEVSGSKLH